MPRHLLAAAATPLLAVWPAHARAADVIGIWGGGEVGAIAIVGVAAALVWHEVVQHRARARDGLHRLHVGDRVRHAFAYVRTHAHLRGRKQR